MLAARNKERVDHPLAAHPGAAGPLQFGIEEAEIEHRIVRDELRIAEKGDEVFRFVAEQRLVLEELTRQAVDRERRIPACRVPD